MTALRAPRRASAALLAGVLAALASAVLALAVLALGPAAAASASLGSVPAQVAAYVADGGMVARLSDVYGKNAAGAGIDFDATTKAGPISRVYEWTAARLASPKTDHPVQLTNNWVVPVTIGDKPVGLATLWINPQTVAPELADFAPTPALATALAAVPATAALVRDSKTHAWLALADGTVTPLVAGTSRLSKPTPVGSVKLSGTATPVLAPQGSNGGLGLAIGAVGIVVVMIVVALLVPRRRRPKAAVAVVPDDAAPVEPETETVAVEPAKAEPATPEPEPVVEPAKPEPANAEPESEPAHAQPEPAKPEPAKPAPKPRAARPGTTKPATPVTKPIGSKPGSRPSASAAASTKPRTQKPPAQKPPAQKPPTQRPPTRKPPTAPNDASES